MKTLASHVGSLPTLLADDVLTVDNVSVVGNRTIVSGCSVHYNSGRNKDQILVVFFEDQLFYRLMIVVQMKMYRKFDKPK